MQNYGNRKNLLKSIGLGILLAGAAIGGSHLLAGKYKWLDRGMKIQISLLALATVIALGAAIHYNHGFVLSEAPPPVWNKTGILFLIALMGWMPARAGGIPATDRPGVAHALQSALRRNNRHHPPACAGRCRLF